MAILGNAVKGSIVDRENGKVLSQEQIKEIQRVRLVISAIFFLEFTDYIYY